MIVPFNSPGGQGLNFDLPPHELSLGIWSAGRNVRFVGGSIERTKGSAEVSTPSVAPYFSMFQRTESYNYWVYAGLAKVYCYDGTSHTNITRQTLGTDVDYTASASTPWNGGVFGGLMILNNGVDDPQYWSPPSAATKLMALPNWPASTKARVVKPYKNYLVALDVTKSSTRYPHLVKWSHSAEPGSVPDSWDPTDTAKDAGEYPLGETLDPVVDQFPQRDTNVVYKNNSTWGMAYVGGVEVFRFYRMFSQFGALAQDCVAVLPDGSHVVYTGDDLLLHDGQTVKSLITDRAVKALVATVDSTNYARSFVYYLPLQREVWACIPTGGATLPNFALIWRPYNNTLGVRDLPNVSHIGFGFVTAAGAVDVWEGDTQPWEGDSSVWGQTNANPAFQQGLMSIPGTTQWAKVDVGATELGTAYESYIERLGLGIPVREPTPPDFTSLKLMKRVWPRVEGTTGDLMEVMCGSQDTINGPVTWKQTRQFRIGQDRHVDFSVTGRLLALRFRSTSAFLWKCHGFDYEVEESGKY
jgi:hypothetical protein